MKTGFNTFCTTVDHVIIHFYPVLLTQQQLFRCGKNVAAIKKYETISLQHPKGTVFLNSNLSTMSLSDPGIKLK